MTGWAAFWWSTAAFAAVALIVTVVVKANENSDDAPPKGVPADQLARPRAPDAPPRSN